jgi:hypothetical protein
MSLIFADSKFYCLIQNQIQMKKLYSLVVFVMIGAAFSYGQVPNSQKLQKSTSLGSLSQAPSKAVLPHFAPNQIPSNARQGQPSGGNQVQWIFSDNFDMPSDTDALKARGYNVYYRGTGPQVAATWFQGNDAVFPAHSGAATSYVAANYQVVELTNNIDNWLVLPALDLTTADILSFWSRSPDGSQWPDSIRVMYNAAGDSLPESGSWVQIDNFVVSINGWEQKSYNVPTASTTGRWAIRYSVVNGGPDGSNSNYIGIDDLNVGQLPADDVAMQPGFPSQYTMIPLPQVQPIELEATMTNTGGNTETNVGFDASVYISHDFGMTYSQVFNGPSNAEASLASGGTSGTLSAGQFTFTDTGLYAFQYIAFMDNQDLDSTNDFLTNFIYVTDSTYARDYVFIAGSATPYGAPDQSTATFGNIYDIYNPAIMKSVTIEHAFATLGASIRVDIYDVSGGAPNSIIASSADYAYTANDTSSQFLLELTLPLLTPLAVPAGPVFVSVAQLDASQAGVNNMGVGFTTNIFTPGTSFIQVDANPFDVVENFSLSGTWAIRPNLDIDDAVPQNELSKGISVYPNPTNGKLFVHNSGQKERMTVTVLNNVGQVVYTNSFDQMTTAVIDLSSQSSGVYSVQVKSDKEVTTKSVVISNK